MPIANTSSTTTVTNVRLKLNEVIGVVNTLGTGNVSNTYLQSTFATKAYAASNTAVRLLINDRLQVANAAAKYTTKAYAASNAYVKLILANTNAYIHSLTFAANTTFINNAPTATGSSLIYNRINSTVYLKKIRAGRNIEILEQNGEIILTAIEQRDYGYIDNDFGSITNAPDVNNLYDYGSI